MQHLILKLSGCILSHAEQFKGVMITFSIWMFVS